MIEANGGRGANEQGRRGATVVWFVVLFSLRLGVGFLGPEE
jgi:hypothetical protein